MKRGLTFLGAVLALGGLAQVPGIAGGSKCMMTAFMWLDSSEGYPTPEEALAAVSGDSVEAAADRLDSTDVDVSFLEVEDGFLVDRILECSGPAATALAHNWGEMFEFASGNNARWADGSREAIPWSFTSEVGSGAKHDSIVWGSNRWTAVGADLGFDHDHASDGGNYGFDSAGCSQLNNKVHWEDINGNPLGAAKVCTDADNKIYTFAVAFDPDYNWNSGSEDPGPSQADLRWVAAHEFGHAAGYSHHWDDSHNHLSCPEDSTKHTMCSTATHGQAWGRTLEIHDVHTFTDAY